MSNHRWTNIADALPPIDKEYVAYIPDGRRGRHYHIARDSLTATGSRLTVVGNLFAWDLPPIEKWILCEELFPPIE